GVAASRLSATTAAAAEAAPEGDVPGVDPLALDDLGGQPSREDLDRATTRLDPGVATTFELAGAVTSLEYVAVEEDEGVVTLETDVLFDVSSAGPSQAAVERAQEIGGELADARAETVP